MIPINIIKLALFVDLIKTRNYTETAEKFYTTQGNVSKQIISLEKQIGAKLLERSHRTIELTEVGALILPNVKRIVEEYQQMERLVKENEANKNSLLNIYTIPTMSNYLGFSKIIKFKQDYPDITIQFTEKESNKLFKELKKDNNVIAFMRVFQMSMLENYESVITDKDEFYVILPQDHPSAQETVVELAALKKEKFVMLGHQTNLYQPSIELCRKAGFEPQIEYEGSRLEIVLKMVASKLGVAVAMKKTIPDLTNSGVVARPVTPTQSSYLAFVRTTAEHSLASNSFWEYIKKIM